MQSSISLPDIQKQIATLTVAERFFDSVVVFALFNAGVFEALAVGPRTHKELQEEIKGDSESLLATLNAAVALKVLVKDGEHFSASEAMLDCLGRKDSPAYLGEWVTFLHALATPLLKLDEEVRHGSKPGALYEDMSGDNLPAMRLTQAMDAYARTRGIEVVTRIDFSSTQRLLDVGCGPGTYSIAIVDRHPHIRATLLDLPGPIQEARRIVEQRGMIDRVDFAAGDAMTWQPDEPFDTVFISNMLHMLGPDASKKLIARIFELVSPGGRLIIQAQYLNDDMISPRWATIINLMQRLATPNGRNHAISETTQWLQQGGFEKVEYVPMSVWNVNRCLVGTKPS